MSMRTELEIYNAMRSFYTQAIAQRDRGHHDEVARVRAHILAAKAHALAWVLHEKLDPIFPPSPMARRAADILGGGETDETHT